MGSEIKQLKHEIGTLKRENTKLREENSKLQQSLDELRTNRPRRATLRSLKLPSGQSHASPATAGEDDSELQRALIEQLIEMRQQLSTVQDRLTVAEQVTAATQRRELAQEGVCETDSDYEELEFDTTEEHVYARLKSSTQKDVLRRQCGDLSTKLDAYIVAAHMYQRNALTVKELQTVQSLRDRPVEAAEKLLNIIMEQPDAVYLSFLDVLKHTQQQHIYQTLVEDGYQDYDDQSSHTRVIRTNYVFLLEKLDSKLSGLVDQLFSDEVITAEERDGINAEKTSFRANEKLLSVLSRKSQQQFQQFLDALDDCGQQHVCDVITGPREGQVVDTLPEGRPVGGVTILGELLYLVRPKDDGDQVEVYDVLTYRLQRCLTVPNARGFTDMTSCEHFLCLYIADPDGVCVHRLDLQGNARQWPVCDRPCGLSVNAAHHLIVTCRLVGKIKEFSSHGDLMREVTLPGDVINPFHATQLTSGQFIVCHGVIADPVHRVCMISADGRQIVHSHGGQRGSHTGHYKVPYRLAVGSDRFVFVVDVINHRVTLLSSTLSYIRHVVSSDQFKWRPGRLCFDVRRRRLYVADDEVKDGKFTAGRVVVYSV